jgi:hypothetical protein
MYFETEDETFRKAQTALSRLTGFVNAHRNAPFLQGVEDVKLESCEKSNVIPVFFLIHLCPLWQYSFLKTLCKKNPQ